MAVSRLIYRIVRAPTPPPFPGAFEAAAGERLRTSLIKRFGRARQRKMRAAGQNADAPLWHVFDDRLSKRFALPWVMVIAPRWYTYARILIAGPFGHET